MSSVRIAVFILLGLLWLWLAWAVLSVEITLYRILLVAISGAIVFIPLWQKLQERKK